jgi:hypothetical protein
MSEDQIIDWFTKNDQRLTTAAGIKKQFPGGTIADEATKGHIVQWLQKDYGDPKTRLFSYDPAWASHFILVPGK